MEMVEMVEMVGTLTSDMVMAIFIGTQAMVEAVAMEMVEMVEMVMVVEMEVAVEMVVELVVVEEISRFHPPPPHYARILISDGTNFQIYNAFSPISNVNEYDDFVLHNTGSRELSEDCKNILKKYGILNKNGKLDEDKLDELLDECRQFVPELAEKIRDSQIHDPCNNRKIELDAEGIEIELCLTGNYSRAGLSNYLDDALERGWIKLYLIQLLIIVIT